MRLASRIGPEVRYALASAAVSVGFIGVKSDATTIVAFAVMVLVALCAARSSGSVASWITLDSQEIVAHFTLRSPVRIPLSRIAAVEVHRRISNGRLWGPVTFITVFRKDEASVIEIAANGPEAEPFVRQLVRNAKALGVKDVAPFAVPRSWWLYELLPLVPALALFTAFPSWVSWPACGAGIAAYLLFSAIVWFRYAKVATRIVAGVPAEEVAEWTLWIRAS